MRLCLTVSLAVMMLASNLTAEVVIETVPVGNPGNIGDWAGASVRIYGNYFGVGEDRLCGTVEYPFEMGKFEITVSQYCEFLNAVAADDPHELWNDFAHPYPGPGTSYGSYLLRNGVAGSYFYTVGTGSPEDIANWGSRPINGIAWADAARFANWMHNGQPAGPQDSTTTEDGSYLLNGAETNPEIRPVVRHPWATWVVPSEDEWYKAAYHKNDGATANYWTYPTRFTGVLFGSLPGNNVVDPDPGNSACYHIGSPDDDCIGPPYWRTPVGEFENSFSSYGTFDQGGNVWEWTDFRLLDANGNPTSKRIVRGASYYPSVVAGDNDGFIGMHAATRMSNFTATQHARYGFRLAKVNNDCNANQILDQTELAGGTAFDRNYNGIIDICDITSGASEDCNENGIPDEAEVGDAVPPPYRLDDGVAAGLLRGIGYNGTETDGYMMWLNQFSVAIGRETIGAIVPWCFVDLVPAGTPFTVYLWSDPDGDGNPMDAVVLASAATTMTTLENAVDIPDTYVGPPGTNFFIGAIMHVTDVEVTYPASFDDSKDHRRSWFAYGPTEIDPGNVGVAENFTNMSDWYGTGSWMVHALPAVTVTQVPDLDNNGVPDSCEIVGCQTMAGDLNGDNGSNAADIQGFVDCYRQGPGVATGCSCADMNSPQPDGTLDAQDISVFVNQLLGL